MHQIGLLISRTGRVWVTLLVIAASWLTQAATAQTLPPEAFKSGSNFLVKFRPLTEVPRHSVVDVLVNGEHVALGTVVSKYGEILTKASQMHGEIEVRTHSGQEYGARVVAVDGASDLALVKTNASNLVPVQWAASEPGVGSWLVSVGTQREPLGVGVVSVAGRRIAPQRGVLGVELVTDAESQSPIINRVFPGSGAESAGLQVGDVIMSVAGQAISDRDGLLRRLSLYRPGDSLELLVRRGDKDEELKATLGNEQTMMVDRQARQNMMAGPLSVRSGGFERVLQHDTVLRPEDCGGPVVDLSGHVVGLNIARAGRVESYVLPSSEIQATLKRLNIKAPQEVTAQK